MPARKKKDGYLIQPDPLDPRLTERITGVDQTGEKITTAVTVERALTIFLNSQEIVTAMTIGDYPEYLAIGYLLNQNMLLPTDTITSVDYDEDLAVVVVRTRRELAAVVKRNPLGDVADNPKPDALTRALRWFISLFGGISSQPKQSQTGNDNGKGCKRNSYGTPTLFRAITSIKILIHK